MSSLLARTTAYVADTVRLYIEGLSHAIEKNDVFVMSAGGILGVRCDEVAKIFKREFVEEVEEALLPPRGRK